MLDAVEGTGEVKEHVSHSVFLDLQVRESVVCQVHDGILQFDLWICGSRKDTNCSQEPENLSKVFMMCDGGITGL